MEQPVGDAVVGDVVDNAVVGLAVGVSELYCDEFDGKNGGELVPTI